MFVLIPEWAASRRGKLLEVLMLFGTRIWVQFQLVDRYVYRVSYPNIQWLLPWFFSLNNSNSTPKYFIYLHIPSSN